jgi:hypothetical protein
MSRGSFAVRAADRPHPVVAANWRSQPIAGQGRPGLVTRLSGRLGAGVRAREAYGVRRPEPALWLGRKTAHQRTMLPRREGKAATALRSVTALQELARVPERLGSRRPEPFLFYRAVGGP